MFGRHPRHPRHPRTTQPFISREVDLLTFRQLSNLWTSSVGCLGSDAPRLSLRLEAVADLCRYKVALEFLLHRPYKSTFLIPSDAAKEAASAARQWQSTSVILALVSSFRGRNLTRISPRPFLGRGKILRASKINFPQDFPRIVYNVVYFEFSIFDLTILELTR